MVQAVIVSPCSIGERYYSITILSFSTAIAGHHAHLAAWQRQSWGMSLQFAERLKDLNIQTQRLKDVAKNIRPMATCCGKLVQPWNCPYSDRALAPDEDLGPTVEGLSALWILSSSKRKRPEASC